MSLYALINYYISFIRYIDPYICIIGGLLTRNVYFKDWLKWELLEPRPIIPGSRQ